MNKAIVILVCLFPFFNAGFATAAAADEIKIAAVLAKTGDAAESNLEIFEAFRFAVAEVNSKGGVLGKKINLIEYDNHSTPIQSKLAAQQAVKDGVVAVMGASWSSHSLAMAPYLQKMKVPMISSGSTNPDVTLAGDYIFRICFVDSVQGKVLARFTRNDLKAATVVIMQNITSDYSLGLTKIFAQNFTAGGGKVLAFLNYKSGRTDFTDLLKAAQELNPDVLFIPEHSESGSVVRQAQDLGIKAKMLGGDGWPCRQFYANGGQDIEEGYYTTSWNKDLDTAASRDFVARYSKVYEVTDFSALPYDTAMLLFDAIHRAGSVDRGAIRDAIAATKDFDGVSGKISFDTHGDPIKQVIMMKITKGQPAIFKIITPD
ncbi:ABC transporter substrate-binding protein [Desulforhopalus vacuolatus]|uniref:ABC transporter substrate-binding protein n=1 Tax=Desulforhopalus vacuolatus TaxID=40414 RepID=UPI001962620C|nr:ABC transporter substrate-binding protein [Desulforhopalus vacuolatus]MBM9519090.1 ABC transporter substrate-binding protein [Desulforhopalus vacuolatus]